MCNGDKRECFQNHVIQCAFQMLLYYVTYCFPIYIYKLLISYELPLPDVLFSSNHTQSRVHIASTF